MSLTTDPKHPRLGHGVDEQPVPQNEVYLVLSPEELAKGFVRPVRHSYQHVGPSGPRFPLQELTSEQIDRFGTHYARFEPFPESESPALGRYWTQSELDAIGKGCGTVTTMGQALAETYAREPRFYGSTYCCGCRRHLRVAEFVWDGTDQRVGT
jgi:hypothetical protein